MSVTSVAGVALLSLALILCLRELRASFALPARLAAVLFLVSAALLLYVPVVDRIRELFDLSGGGDYAALLLRAAGIALICELTACFCRDLGENTLAGGVLLFGRLEIVILSLPLIGEVLEIAKELLKF